MVRGNGRWFPAVVVAFALSMTAVAQAAAPAVTGSRAYGDTRAGWARSYFRWALGDGSNPTGTGVCGAVVDGAFFLTPPFLGDYHHRYSCEIPAGLPVVVSHAFAWAVEGDADDDAGLLHLAQYWFVPRNAFLRLDGRSLPLFRTTVGLFDVRSEAGSYFDQDYDLGTGTFRLAAVGNVTILRPLEPGGHVLVGAVDYLTHGPPISFGVTYDIVVRASDTGLGT